MLAGWVGTVRGATAVTAGILAALLAAFGLLAWRNYDSEVEATRESLAMEASATAETIDVYLGGLLKVLVILADTPRVKSAEPQQVAEVLEPVTPAELGFASIGWIDSQGVMRVVRSEESGAVPVDLAGREYVRRALAEATPVVASAVLGSASGVPVVVLAAPVLGAAGEPNGLVAGSIRLDQAANFPATLRIPQDGLVVIDSAGQIIVREGPVRELSNPDGRVLAAVSTRPDGVLSSPGVDGETDQVVAFATVPTAGWSVIIQTPESVAYGNARTALRNVILGGASGAVLVLASVALGTHRIQRRGMAAAQAARDRDIALRRYTSLTDTMTPIVFEASADGAVSFANKRWEEYTGITGDDVNWRGAIHPGDSDLRALFSPAQGGGWEAELRLRRSDGVYRWHLARVAPLSAEGEPARFIGTLVDIHDRRVAEEATARLAAVVSSSTDAIITFDLDGIVTSWNPAAERILGYAAAEVVGQHYHFYLHPDRHAPADRARERLLAGEPMENVTSDYVRKDGSRVVLSVSVAALRDSRGAIVGATTIGRDITWQVAAEEAVRASEQRFSALLAGIPAHVALYDAAGEPRFTNRSWLAYAGAGDQALDAGQLLDRVHPAERSIAEECIHSPEGASFEARLQHWTGQYLWHLVRVVPVPAISPPLREWVMVAMDIQEIKDHESVQEARIAEQDEFLGLLAHELRSPLTTLSGFANLLVRRPEDLSPEAVAEAHEEILAGSARLERILENMLSLAHFDSDADREAEPVLLQRTAAAIAKRFSLEFPGAYLELDVEHDAPPVLAGPLGVEQVLWNLLTNAAKYGAQGGRVTLRVRNLGSAVETLVEDEGEGVPAHEQARLFQPFFRSRAARTRASGLGLGLAVCRRIINAYGGSMFARSGSPRGMVFGFRLPVVEELAATSADSMVEKPARTWPQPSRQGSPGPGATYGGEPPP